MAQDVGQFWVRLLCLAVQQDQFADDLHRLTAGLRRDQIDRFPTRLAVLAADPDLDQFVIFQGALDFRQYALGQSLASQQDNGIQLMADLTVAFFLGYGQRHGEKARNLLKRAVILTQVQVSRIVAVRINNRNLSKSSKDWLKEHFEDPYVQRAQKDGYRARAAYKLLEIQEKDKLIRPGMTVVDLGAAPGSWSQIAARLCGAGGMVIASDILEMDPLPDVNFLQGDFREQEVFDRLLDMLNGRPVDLVISDMAPNTSGNAAMDQPRSMYLCELALDFAVRVLKPDGRFLVKVFQGEGYEEYRKEIQRHFSTLKSRKPDASRARSREMYLLAAGFRAK